MKFTLVALACCVWLAPAVAHAQVHLSYGPKVGYNLATTDFKNFPNSTTSYRSGLEAGIMGSAAIGHFALQPAVLYSQKGYRQSIFIPDDIVTGALYYNGNTRLDYVSIPVNFVFAQHLSNQGLQLFAGPYLGLLLGGRYEASVVIDNGTTSIPGPPPATTPQRGKVMRSTNYSPSSNQTYSKGLDAGLQAGIGYQRGGWLLQATYSIGLRNISEHEFAANVGFYNIPYYNRAFQTSLVYLFGLKNK